MAGIPAKFSEFLFAIEKKDSSSKVAQLYTTMPNMTNERTNFKYSFQVI